MQFSQAITDRIGYYVYQLTDPRNGQIFYIGKGNGNRVFAHVNEAIRNPENTDKLSRIRKIREAGLEVHYDILRHGLTEKEAFEVEAAMIDYLTQLANLKIGQASTGRGRMTVPEIIATYDPQPITIREPVLLITPRKLYKRNMSDLELYDITRGNWVISKKRDEVKYAFALRNGIVLQVYRIKDWEPVKARRLEQKHQDRWRFNGEIATDMQHYIGKSVVSYITPSSRNPIKYVNCN
jgi:hypothetical protein